MKEGQFVTEIQLDSSINAPTVIHALHGENNQIGAWYPQGFDVITVDSEGSPIKGEHMLMNVSSEFNELHLQATHESLDDKVVRICITPKGVEMDCSGFKLEYPNTAAVEDSATSFLF